MRFHVPFSMKNLPCFCVKSWSFLTLSAFFCWSPSTASACCLCVSSTNCGWMSAFSRAPRIAATLTGRVTMRMPRQASTMAMVQEQPSVSCTFTSIVCIRSTGSHGLYGAVTSMPRDTAPSRQRSSKCCAMEPPGYSVVSGRGPAGPTIPRAPRAPTAPRCMPEGRSSLVTRVAENGPSRRAATAAGGRHMAATLINLSGARPRPPVRARGLRLPCA
mmetsp:Transcript_106027/g.299940  ORF Transcript_106027/g.299940 Transcript_106027/m.299940 type:complete len:217 (+) Transcript_106027:883-1533(+)